MTNTIMIDKPTPQTKGKTILSILKVFGDLTDAVFSWSNNIDEDLSGNRDITALREKMYECLNPKGGEITARNNTISLGNLYLNLSEEGKIKFFYLLITDFSASKEEIYKRIEAYRSNMDVSLDHSLGQKLTIALESPRVKILKQFISLSNGLNVIVEMRADVIKMKKQHPDFSLLEQDLRNILSAWFDVGLLDLCRITWDSPASLLEKLIVYEAVHEIASWDDLRNRLDSDRRCFAFFHYKIPNEPLVFVEVALTNEIATNIQVLLDESIPTEDTVSAKAAIFYSISNTQSGLSGINLGNFLIKRVVSKLSQEFKNIKIYATLSPIPGFVNWLKHLTDRKVLEDLKISLTLEDILNSIDSLKGSDYSDEIKNSLLKLCAYYLVKVKNAEKALDSVAHFHLSNGASIKRLNWLADTSEKGFKQSAGIMVNYCYELDKIDDNHENYLVKKKINCTREVLSLLK